MEFDMLNLKRAVRGDERAFEALIEPYADATYRLCLRMMGNEQDAADMAQEAFLRAWRSLSSYKGQSRFSTWLYRVTSNVCLDELRRRRRGETESMQALEENGFEPVDPAETPEMALDRRSCAATSPRPFLSWARSSAPRSSCATCRACPTRRSRRFSI